MGENSAIEWTDATWTPIRARHRETGRVGWFCTHVSGGCLRCYSETLNHRLGNGVAYRAQDLRKVEMFLDEKMLTAPLRWRKPRMIFVCSMTDLFGEFVPDEWIDRVFAVMALAPQHTFQVLTKRAQRMRKYMTDNDDAVTTRREAVDEEIEKILRTGNAAPAAWEAVRARRYSQEHYHSTTGVYLGQDNWIETEFQWPLPNVWLGASVEDQTRADERIPHLLATPAALRFLSCEPLLGSIDLSRIQAPKIAPDDDNEGWKFNCLDIGDYCSLIEEDGRFGCGGDGPYRDTAIDLVICGGESGPGARPMHPAWARSIRDQCVAAGVPFFFKQWGEWIDADEWFDQIERTGCRIMRDDRAWTPARPLNFSDAQILAKATGRSDLVHNSDGTTMIRVGKRAAGNLLDGRRWQQFPGPVA